MFRKTMRTGLIADIHGNLVALETVLAELERERDDASRYTGNIIGISAETHQRIREQVFGWPGIGTQAWQAVQIQDIPMIMGTVLLASLLIVAANLVIDLLYLLLDPRITYR